MVHRRQFLILGAFASALMLLSSSSCTPDERSLDLSLNAQGGDAGSSASGAAGELLAGSAGDENDSGQAGEREAAGTGGAPAVGGANAGGAGGVSAGAGGVAGDKSNGGAGGSVGSAGIGGNIAVGGNAGNAGAAGSAGATAFPCGDIDGNSVDDCSETLVANSRFDTNADHWTSGTWNASNARPGGSSGSLLVVNDLPVVNDTGYNLKAAEQCIPVTGDLNYAVGARVMIPTGQGSGFGGLNLWIYANDGCQGTFVTGLSPATTQVTNAWTAITAEFKMPTAARSMSVRLAATRPFAQTKLQVLFDDILVKQKLP